MIYQKYFKIGLVMLLLLSYPKSNKAQIMSGAFFMSSVGSIQNFSNNSISIVFSSNSTCLNLQNGAAVHNSERGSGLFVSNCLVNTKINQLGIILFPNPVSSTTRVKFKNTPPLDDVFLISIWNVKGFKIYSTNAKGYELYQGKLLDFSTINAGTYIIKIESEKYIDAFKFIKTI
jgi:hypothetical protein